MLLKKSGILKEDFAGPEDCVVRRLGGRVVVSGIRRGLTEGIGVIGSEVVLLWI